MESYGPLLWLVIADFTSRIVKIIFFYTDLKQPSAPSPNTAAHSLYVMISTSAHSHPSSVVYFNIAFNIHSTKSLS